MKRRTVLTTPVACLGFAVAGCLGDGSGAETGEATESTAGGTETDVGETAETAADSDGPTTETETESGPTETEAGETGTAVRTDRGTTAGTDSPDGREFAVTGTEGQAVNEANVAFANGGSRVVVTGTITGKNGCRTAVLDSVRTEGPTLTVTVSTREDPESGDVCSQALVGIGYRLVVTPETPPQSVRVVHRGANGRGEFVRQRDG